MVEVRLSAPLAANPGEDPQYGDMFWYHSGFIGYFGGYSRFAGWRPGPGANWANSGHTNLGLIGGKVALKSIGGDQDAILADRITTEAFDWTAGHGPDHFTWVGYRENNVAYADVHVETHRHDVQEDPPTYQWDGHYVIEHPVPTYHLY